MIKINCLTCNKKFKTYQSRIKIGKGKFCSKKCFNITLLGKDTWNKGKKGLQKWNSKKYEQMRKIMLGNSYGFKKGQPSWNKGLVGIMPIPWNKGKKVEQTTGSKNWIWKGDKVGYYGIHHWVKRHKGEAVKCDHCEKFKTTPKSIQWANIDHKYRRNLADFISLCISCHRQYDIKYNNYKIKPRHKVHTRFG